jgi:hypothetical protein
MRFWLFVVVFVGNVFSCGPTEEDPDPPVVIVNNMSGNNAANGGLNNDSPNGGTVNGSANNTSVPDDLYPVLALMQLGSSVAEDVDTLLNNTVEAVWFASEQTGTPTYTGTIRQQGQAYSYEAGPSDKLVIALDGVTLEIVIRSFDGYQELTWVEFAEANAVDFTISSGDDFSLTIVNNSRFSDDCTDAVYRTCYTWERSVSGRATFGGKLVELNLSDAGRTRYSVDGNFSTYQTGREVAGTASTADETMTVRDASSSELIHSGVTAQESRNFAVNSSGTAQVGAETVTLSDVFVQWEDVNSLTNPGATPLVSQPNFWEARGTVSKGSATWGTVRFDGEVVPNTAGPAVVLQKADGTVVQRFRPIEI